MMQVYIAQDFSRNRIYFYMYYLNSTGRTFLVPNLQGGFQHIPIGDDQIIDGNEALKPTLSLSMEYGFSFIKEVAAFAKNEGISVKEQSNNEGNLSATEKHNDFLQSNLTKLIDHLTK